VSEENNNDDLINEVDNFLENFVPPEMSEDEIKPVNTIVLDLIDPQERLLVDVVAKIERYFWATGQLPNFMEFIDAGVSIEEIKEIVNPKLRGRGIPEYSFNKISTTVGDDGFDPRFVLACNVMCRASGKSKGAKFKDLASLGVSEPMWNAWLSMPGYFEYAKNLMEIQFQSVTDIDAKMGLARNVANGDLSSIKYYHEFTNRYRPTDQNAVNLMGIIGLLMEVLARNVSADVFDKIAGELEQTPVGELMGGN
jgi:hypothetical protein